MEVSLTHEAFARQVDTKFQVQVDDTQRVDLELAEVSDVKESPVQEQFSLVFRGPQETFLGQGLRSFQHDQMGEFELFIVPIRQDEEGYYYEAIFNRFHE